jgi:hypothetical protein
MRKRGSMADMRTPVDVVEPEPVVEPRSTKPAYREGKRAFTAYTDIERYRTLKRMAADLDSTVQALLDEGMDLVAQKYGYTMPVKRATEQTSNTER